MYLITECIRRRYPSHFCKNTIVSQPQNSFGHSPFLGGGSKGSADPPEIPRGARSGRGPVDHFDARSDGWTTGMYARGEEDEGSCPSLRFCGPPDGGPRPGIHTAGPSMFPYREPVMGFHTAGQVGLSYGWPRRGFHTANSGRALAQRAPTGRTLRRRPLTGPQSAGLSRPFKWRAPVSASVGGP